MCYPIIRDVVTARGDVERGVVVQLPHWQEENSRLKVLASKVISYLHSFDWGRFIRNMTRVLLTGTLSALGTLIAGEKHIYKVLGICALVFGAFLSGLANGLSTRLAWESQDQGRIDLLERQVQVILTHLRLNN